MVPKHEAEVLFSVSKFKKAVRCLVEKMHVLGKLSSSMSYSVVHWEFNVNVSAPLNKVPLNGSKVMYWSVVKTL